MPFLFLKYLPSFYEVSEFFVILLQAGLYFLLDVGFLPGIFAALYSSLQVLNPKFLLFKYLLLVVGLRQDMLQCLQIFGIELDGFQQIVKLLFIGYFLLYLPTIVLPHQVVAQQLL